MNKPLLVGAGLVTLLVGAGVLAWMLRPGEDPFPKGAWARRTIGRVSLDAPFEFKSAPTLSMPGEVDLMDARANANTNSLAEVMVGTAIYRGEVSGSLDRAVAGAMQSVGARAGSQRKVPYDSVKIVIGGRPARRARYKGKHGGQNLTVEAIFILEEDPKKSTILTMVMVAYSQPAHWADAIRILDSVKLAPRGEGN